MHEWQAVGGIRRYIKSFPKNTKVYQRDSFVSTHLNTCDYVWLKREVVKSLMSPYEGPFKILERDDKMKTLVIDKDGTKLRASVDRLKPAFVFKLRGQICRLHVRLCVQKFIGVVEFHFIN